MNTIQHGLCLVLQHALNFERDEPRIIRKIARFAEHPFGLQVPQGVTIRFHGYPGYTDESVNGFLSYIASRLAGHGGEFVSYLRVIKVAINPKELKQHMVFFEVGLPHEVLMCGGCSDCSGTGGAGKEDLDAVFAFLSNITGVKPAEVEVKAEQGRLLFEHICKLYETEVIGRGI